MKSSLHLILSLILILVTACGEVTTETIITDPGVNKLSGSGVTGGGFEGVKNPLHMMSFYHGQKNECHIPEEVFLPRVEQIALGNTKTLPLLSEVVEDMNFHILYFFGEYVNESYAFAINGCNGRIEQFNFPKSWKEIKVFGVMNEYKEDFYKSFTIQIPKGKMFSRPNPEEMVTYMYCGLTYKEISSKINGGLFPIVGKPVFVDKNKVKETIQVFDTVQSSIDDVSVQSTPAMTAEVKKNGKNIIVSSHNGLTSALVDIGTLIGKLTFDGEEFDLGQCYIDNEMLNYLKAAPTATSQIKMP